jgi:hypothetical protein
MTDAGLVGNCVGASERADTAGYEVFHVDDAMSFAGRFGPGVETSISRSVGGDFNRIENAAN